MSTNDDTARMFQRMLSAAPVVPAAVHRAAWRHATLTGRTDLAKELVGRVDAPADLVARYATLTETDLRAVFLGRPDATEDALVAGIAGERRASVLAEALRSSNQHPAVVAVAAEVFLARPTKALVESMSALPDRRMTPALVEAILSVHDKTPATVHVYGAKLPAGMLGRDRARTFLATVSHPNVAAWLMHYDVGNDIVVETVNRIFPDVMKLCTDKSTSYAAQFQARDFLAAAATGRLGDSAVTGALLGVLRRYRGDLVDQLRKQLTAPAKTTTFTRWPVGAGDETREVVTADELDTTPATAFDVTAASVTELAAHAASADADVVSQVAARVVALGPADPSWGRWVTTLLGNPKLSVADRHQLLRNLPPAPWGSTELSCFDALNWFPGDDLVRETWCTRFPAAVLAMHGWEPFGGRDQAGAWMVSWATSPDQELRNAAVAGLRVGVDRDVLRQLPLATLRPLWNQNHDGAARTMLGLVADLLADELGDDPDAWVLYDRLKANFPGTLGELLETCQAAAA